MSMGDLKTLQKEGSEGTSTRSMLGTYEYMSPEQKRGEEATAQSDLYAVGLMAFKLLTGQNPGVKPPSRVYAGLIHDWDGMVERSLEENMADRWPSAMGMQAALNAIAKAVNEQLEVRAAAAMQEEERRRAEEAILKEKQTTIKHVKLKISGRDYLPEGIRTKTIALGGDATMDFVWIPPGEFQMGSPMTENERSDDEGPQHEVQFSTGFWMCMTEVTQNQYAQMRGVNPSKWKGANLPVDSVSWFDAKTFCEEVSRLLDRRVRLPSEAEWEYACRAETTTAFHCGNQLDSSMANFDGTMPYGGGRQGMARQRTTPVGTFKPNAWGLFDMHGNLFEWCEDWDHDDYNGAPTDGGAWTDPAGQYRILRGGSWKSNAAFCRSARRVGDEPFLKGDLFGFRVVMEVNGND